MSQNLRDCKIDNEENGVNISDHFYSAGIGFGNINNDVRQPDLMIACNSIMLKSRFTGGSLGGQSGFERAASKSMIIAS